MNDPGQEDTVAPGGILALDIATVTGWAYAPPEAVEAWPELGALSDSLFAQPPLNRVVWGSQRFGASGCDPGLVAHEAHSWLTAQIEKKRPSLLAVEQPLPWGRMKQNADVQRRLGNVYGVLDLVRFRASVAYLECNVGSARLHFVGDGRASKRVKRIIKRCHERGWDVGADDNAADALAVLDYAVAQATSVAERRRREFGDAALRAETEMRR